MKTESNIENVLPMPPQPAPHLPPGLIFSLWGAILALDARADRDEANGCEPGARMHRTDADALRRFIRTGDPLSRGQE